MIFPKNPKKPSFRGFSQKHPFFDQKWPFLAKNPSNTPKTLFLPHFRYKKGVSSPFPHNRGYFPKLTIFIQKPAILCPKKPLKKPPVFCPEMFVFCPKNSQTFHPKSLAKTFEFFPTNYFLPKKIPPHWFHQYS